MKKIFRILSFITVSTAIAVACDAEYTEYEGPEYVAFSDTLFTCPVLESGETFDVTIASTASCDYDRTFGVEVIDKTSNAIEGYHYNLESNSVTIKAGERAGVVKVKSNYANFENSDSLEVTLRLVEPDGVKWELYEDYLQTRVYFQKCCPFDINNFTGYGVVSSTFLYTYANSMNKLIKTEIDPDNENSVILRDLLYDGDTFRDNYDISIKFSTDDPLKPRISLNGEDNIFGNVRVALGYPYGDGWMRTYASPSYDSFYDTCKNYAVLYHYCYVNNVGGIGTFLTMVEWVSDEEAERILREGF